MGFKGRKYRGSRPWMGGGLVGLIHFFKIISSNQPVTVVAVMGR